MISWSGTKQRKKITEFLEFNENVSITHPNLRDKIKAMLREKFIALSAVVKKLRNLTLAS